MNREISASARSFFTEDAEGLPPSRIAKHALGDMLASQDEPCFASRLWFNDWSVCLHTLAIPGHCARALASFTVFYRRSQSLLRPDMAMNREVFASGRSILIEDEEARV